MIHLSKPSSARKTARFGSPANSYFGWIMACCLILLLVLGGLMLRPVVNADWWEIFPPLIAALSCALVAWAYLYQQR